MWCFIIFYMLLQNTGAVKHRVNRTEYQSFPPLFHLDDYELCLSEPGGMYCDVELNIISDERSALLTTMQEYSSLRNKNYNHSLLNYGVCATRRCRKYINATNWDPKTILEKCFNDTLWDNFKIKTKLSDHIFCKRYGESMKIDSFDVFAGILFFIFLLLIVIGSIYEVYWKDCNGKNVNYFLQAFSITRNWSKLCESISISETQSHFKAITSVRTIVVIHLVALHATTGIAIFPANPYDIEELYRKSTTTSFSWMLPVQSCFVISSFLLTNKLQEIQDKKNVSWSQILKLMYLRWLRLFPPFAVLLLFISTWFRNIGDGPLWHRAVSAEIHDCKRDWWRHLLSINNYNIDTTCSMHTWYTAADFQLYLFTMIVCRLIFVTQKKHFISASVLLVAILLPALHTYFQDLDAYIIGTPEFTRATYKVNSPIPSVYRWAHTNLPCCVIGMIASFLVKSLQRNEFNINKCKSYRVIYWCTVPAMATLVMLGSCITGETPRPPILVRSIYAALIKPMFGLCIAIILFGSVLKYEDRYRSILEWRGWEFINQFSYSAYLIQFVVIKTLIGNKNHMTHLNTFNIISETIMLTLSTYLAGFIFWILVEAPLHEITKRYLSVQLTPEKGKKTE